jgi:hypothetical protein
MQVGREVGEINEFAIAESFSYKDIFDRLIKLTSRNSDILVFRYEDIFYNSVSWIEYIISTLNLSIPQDTLNKVIANIDMLPYSEDPKKHHRQGTPFDHLRKLKPATVEMISKILQDAILWFDYRPRVINFTGYRTSNDSPLSTGLNSAFALVNELSRENGYRIDEINHLRQALDEIFNRMPPRDVAQS